MSRHMWQIPVTGRQEWRPASSCVYVVMCVCVCAWVGRSWVNKYSWCCAEWSGGQWRSNISGDIIYLTPGSLVVLTHSREKRRDPPRGYSYKKFTTKRTSVADLGGGGWPPFWGPNFCHRRDSASRCRQNLGWPPPLYKSWIRIWTLTPPR